MTTHTRCLRTTAGIGLCLLLSVGAPVQAQEFLDSHRTIDVSLSVPGAPAPLHSEHSGLGIFNDSLEQNYFDDFNGGYADGELNHYSNITSTQQIINGSFYAFGSTDALGSASTTVESEFIMHDTGSIWGNLLLLNIELGEPGGFNVYFEITGQNSGTVLTVDYFDYEPIGNGLQHVWSLDLEADTYTATYTLYASSFKDTFNQGSFTMGMYIPSPSTSVMFGIAGLVAARRRRA